MSEKKEEVREVEVAEKKPTLERRGANSEIILVELKSVADKSSPIKADDVKKVGKQIIEMFPNYLYLCEVERNILINLVYKISKQ